MNNVELQTEGKNRIIHYFSSNKKAFATF